MGRKRMDGQFALALCRSCSKFKQYGSLPHLFELPSDANRIVGEPKLSWNVASENRWKPILDAIQLSFSKLDYLRIEVGSDYIKRHLVDSDLSWNCADASLFLDKVQEANEKLRVDVAQMLLIYFKGWGLQTSRAS
jgi:hypothetical protein